MEARGAKGFGIPSQILAILAEIPLGRLNIQIGLTLRQVMLLNRILFNSEAWQNTSDDEIQLLEEVDNYFLRGLLKAHSKTSIVVLHLETGTAQEQNPTKGDLYTTIKKTFELINENVDDYSENFCL